MLLQLEDVTAKYIETQMLRDDKNAHFNSFNNSNTGVVSMAGGHKRSITMDIFKQITHKVTIKCPDQN